MAMVGLISGYVLLREIYMYRVFWGTIGLLVFFLMFLLMVITYPIYFASSTYYDWLNETGDASANMFVDSFLD